jgi:hypothetical protein
MIKYDQLEKDLIEQLERNRHHKPSKQSICPLISKTFYTVYQQCFYHSFLSYPSDDDSRPPRKQ